MTDHQTFPEDGSSLWAGMADDVLVDAQGRRRIELRYAGEPPHGDSVHEMTIDGRAFPGLVWGARFAVDPSARYLAASWMAERYARHTVVIDMEAHRYTVPPLYLADFTLRWPRLEGAAASAGAAYDFTGEEVWVAY